MNNKPSSLTNEPLVKPHEGDHSNHLTIWLITFLVIIIVIVIIVIIMARQKKPCTNNDQCLAGEICSGGKCQASGVQSCTSNANCPSGQVCQNGACVVPTSNNCTESSQCPSGTYCDTTTNKCVSQGGRGIVGSPCLKEGDCNPGLYCSGTQTCQNNSNHPTNGSCGNSSQCLIGYYCSSAGECIATSGSQTGKMCSQVSPCATGNYCSSAQICQTGISLIPGARCSSLAQCGAYNGVQYYCDINLDTPICDNSHLSYQITPAFTNKFLVSNQGTSYLSVNNNGGAGPFLMTLGTQRSNNTGISIAQMQYTPGTFSVANEYSNNLYQDSLYKRIANPDISYWNSSKTVTGPSFTGLLGITSNGILQAGVTTASVLYLMELLYDKTRTTGYVIIDQYGNPLMYHQNNILGFYDPEHYDTSSSINQYDLLVRFGIVDNYY